MFEKDLQEFLQNLRQQKKNTGFLRLLANKSGVDYPHLSLIVSGKMKLTPQMYSRLFPYFFEVISLFQQRDKEMVAFRKTLEELDPKYLSVQLGMQENYVRSLIKGKSKMTPKFYSNVKNFLTKQKK